MKQHPIFGYAIGLAAAGILWWAALPGTSPDSTADAGASLSATQTAKLDLSCLRVRAGEGMFPQMATSGR